MNTYWKYVKPHLVYFIVGPILMLTEVCGDVLLPKFMSMIINNGIPDRNTNYIISMGLTMILTTLVMMIGGIGGQFMASNASARFANDLRNDAFKRVQEFSFENIDNFSTGSLVTRLTNDITQLQNVIRMGLIMLLRAPGMLIGAFIMAITINPNLAAILAIVVPLLGLLIIILIKIAFPRFENMQRKIDNMNSNVQENLTNVRVIKSFVRTSYEEDKFSQSNKSLYDAGMNAFKVIIFQMPLMMLAMNITTLAVVWFGGKSIIAGGMEVGDLTAFTTYIVQILMSLMILAMILLQSSRAVASSKRIREVLETEIDINDKNAARKDAFVTEGRIDFKGVSFQYKNSSSESVLENISFTAMPGETVGILGATGCGKTSLVQLIPRLYDVTAGEVLVDGVNVKDYSLKSLREGVAMVLQKNVLFSGSIMDNLRWGDINASDEEVKRIADFAQADGFVSSFTDAYDTELGQGGVNVSGGQKQRLCIARALLKKPKILILDDSTSAVDTATEAKIRSCFKNELKDTTKLIIAQRINSVLDADKIIVLDDGKIVGIGTHSELIETNTEYQEIYYSQKEKEESIS